MSCDQALDAAAIKILIFLNKFVKIKRHLAQFPFKDLAVHTDFQVLQVFLPYY